MTHEFKASSVEELPHIAAFLLSKWGNFRIFAVYGRMGAGKTTFVKEICRQLGATDQTNSPSYTLVNEYAANGITIYHLDLYRLHDLDEALDIGILDYLNSNAYCFIEWPQIIKPLLDENYISIHLHKEPDNSRLISIETL